MPKLSKKLFPFLAILVLFLSPVAVLAQTTTPDTCSCFCKTEKGAVQISEDKVTSDKCESLCEKSGSDFLSCAKSARQYPGNNALCFSAADCAKVKGKLAENQAPECPAGMTYCFPESQKVAAKLNVKIGDLETVGDLGTYVDVLYRWMLGAAAVIAVVFIMIGGLQWVLSAGGASSVATAKSRIKNGIVGLLLLISVSLILQTVNPQLLKLQLPKPSLLRQIILSDSSCENLIKEGYEIETEKNAKLVCGTTAVILKDPSGNQVADGLTCQYTKCANTAYACVGGADPQCVFCGTVSDGNPSSAAKPSPGICSQLQTMVYAKNVTSGKQALLYGNYCSFANGGFVGTQGPGYSIGVGGVQTSSDVSISHDSCFQSIVECPKVVDCESYDDILAHYYNNGQYFYDNLYNFNKTYFGVLCSSDPCGVTGKPGIKSCHWDGDKDCDNVK